MSAATIKQWEQHPEWTAQIYHEGSSGREETFLYFVDGVRRSPSLMAQQEAEKHGFRNVRVGYVIRGHHVQGSPGVCLCHEGKPGCNP